MNGEPSQSECRPASGLVAFSFQFSTRLAAVFAEEVLHIPANGMLQKAPPAAPSNVINGTLISFGVPMSAPITGMNNVRKATGINCNNRGSQSFNFFAPNRIEKADASGIPTRVNNAELI